MSVAAKSSELGLTPGIWSIDPMHSTVEVIVRHMVVSKVRGRFNEFSGTINVAESVEDSTVEATIKAASIFTAQEMRDNHLRSADFLDAEQFPEITFQSTAITAGASSYNMVGDLTIHGVTKSIELNLEFNGVDAHPQGGHRAGFSATGAISRKDFGMEWNAVLESGGVMVSDKVNIELEIQAASPQA